MRKPLAVEALSAIAGVAAGVVFSFATSISTAAADPLICSAKSCSFTSPTGAISCLITADGAACSWSEDERMYSVKLLPNGALDPCINLVAGVGKKCTSYVSTGAPALGYGQTAALGPYTCLAEAQAITCKIGPNGRGFTMNSAGILPVAASPPPPPTPAEAPPPPPPTPAEAPPPPPPDSGENLLQVEPPVSG